MAFDESMTCKEVHKILWGWASVGLPKTVDPEVHVYPHHKDGLFDPLAVPRVPIQESVDSDEDTEDDVAKKAAVTTNTDADADRQSGGNASGDDAPEDDGMPAYVVCLSDQANVMRAGSYWDVKLPFRTLPYSDQTIGELSAAYKNKIGLMITFEESREVGELMETAKAPALGDGAEDGDGVLTLDKCLQAFSAGEQLSKMDTWYCPKCKDHVQAFKKMDLWSVPPILALHLKRFHYDAGYFRDKIDALVQFEEYIDMTPHVMGPQKSQRLKYELFGVSNHIGFGIGGGHYTAYAKVGGKWSLYDDSSVSDTVVEKVCTDEAYVLFYRLVDEKEDEEEGGGGGGGGGADSGEEDAARITSNGSSAAPDDLATREDPPESDDPPEDETISS